MVKNWRHWATAFLSGAGKGFCLSLFIISIFTPSDAAAKTFKIKKTGVAVNLTIGDTLLYSPLGYSVTLEGFTSHTSICAIPGENCGSGYFPGVRVLPKLKVSLPKKCSARIVPKECEFVHQEISSDKESFLELKMVGIFEPCEAHDDLISRSSCIQQVVKGGIDKPPLDPANCDRIKDQPERSAYCVEAVADKLQDAKLCSLIKGRETFQCIWLLANAAGDPDICRTLKKNRSHQNEGDYANEVRSCLDTVKRK